MVNETRKIMEDATISVTATTVRVPVFYGHSESVNVEFERELTPDEARSILSKAPGVVVADDPEEEHLSPRDLCGGEGRDLCRDG